VEGQGVGEHVTGGAKSEEENARPVLGATVFVSDASVEAERIAQSLRGAGYTVVDVPLSMLVARVAVQRPRVILVDADSDGALETVARMRELPDVDAIDVLFFAKVGGAVKTLDQAMANEGNGFFARPIDADAVLKKIESLAGGAPPERPARLTPPPPSMPISSNAASLPPASMRQIDPVSSRPPPARASVPTSAAVGGLRLSARPSAMAPDVASAASADPARRALSAPLSAELDQLLAEAEQRVPMMQASPDSSPPTPEEEIEAVLPAELLESLDEPLEEEDDDDVHDGAFAPGARTGAGGGRHTTGASGGGSTSGAGTHGATGGSSQTGGAAGTGPGDTGVGSKARRGATRASVPAAANEPIAALEPALTPPPVKTHGGTHSGTSSTGNTTGHGVEPPERARSEAPLAMAVSIRAASQPPPQTAYAGASIGAREELGIAAGAESLRRPTDMVAVASMSPPSVLMAGEAPRILARAIATRTTGGIAFDSPDGVRRVVFREGDVVTCASGSDEESLLAFLGVRGELPRETVQRLIGKFPAFGRHAGAALVAHGYLRQDQLWPILRAHAEWILGRMLEATAGNAIYEADPPGRLRAEPGVFGGSTGAEVFVEVLRRVEPPVQAVERLGGGASRIGDGENASLLSECALGPSERELVAGARGKSVQQVLDSAPASDIATVLHAMACLGVVEILRAVGRSSTTPRQGPDDVQPGIDALDEDAVRARVRARLQLVDEGDYFAVLGVGRNATGYEVKRAFLELRRELEPSRILTPAVADLAGDVRQIVAVLEEAYEILNDPARRERYRRAIDAVPKA
jgi:CheY-like chemotaxis protein